MKTPLRLAFCLSMALAMSVPSQASPPQMTVMAKNGTAGLTAIAPNTAINREGIIAFTGNDATGSGVFVVSNPGEVEAVARAGAGRTFAGVGITSGADPAVVYRDFLQGPIYILRKSYISNTTDVMLGSSVNFPANWDSITSNSVDISPDGVAVVSGLIGGSTSTALFIGGSRPMSQPATFSGTVGLRPEISNSGEAVIRDNTGRIITWNSSGPVRVVAGTSNGFAADTGNRPGISTDNTAIAFSGNKSGTGAAVYALVTPTGFAPILIPVAGGPVIEASGEVFDSFTSEQRVGVRAAHSPAQGGGSEDVFTVVFQGSRNGTAGVYTRDIVVTNGVVQPFGQAMELVRSGNSLAGSTVTGFTLYHPINEGGTIAFTVSLADGSTAIVKQRPPITFSRIANPSQITNLNGGVDVPLEPKAEAKMLAGLPAFEGGLVADGVTPWIIKRGGGVPGSSVSITFEVQGGTFLNRTISQRLWVLNGNAWQQSTSAPVAASGDIYAYLEGIDPADVSLAPGSRELIVTVRDNGSGLDVGSSFKIRKPPVVLVHGYNTTGEWGGDFNAVLAQDRPQNDFVKTIKYGVATLSDGYSNENTYWTFLEAAFSLNTKLKEEMEIDATGLHGRWAFTRYDAVGHSQGGLLLRMLCSANRNAGISAFKDGANFNRGRFRRIITIGSPHNGSRFAHYLQQLNNTHNIFALVPTLMSPGSPIGTMFQKAGILQSKFDPWGDQIRELNSSTGPWLPDDDAKFFMIRTTINGGRPPGHPLSPTILAYMTVGLSIGLDTVVLPLGSDGVVDLDSQGYSGGIGNVFDMPNADISHARPLGAFWADSNQVEATDIAEKVRDALNGGVTFGRFSVPPPLPDFVRDAIDRRAAATVSIGNAITAALLSPPPGGPQPAPPNGSYQYMLIPPAGNEVQGTVDWTAEVFGPDGVTQTGVSVTVNALDSKQVTVTVDPAVVGDVVLYARYGLANGGVAFAAPIKVVSIAPSGATLVSIEVDHGSGAFPAGTQVLLHLKAKFSDGSKLLVYPGAGSGIYSSLTPSTAEVTPEGLVTLKGQGTATILASYQGQTTQAQFTVTPGSAPVITIPAPLAALVGQPFQYQTLATNMPTNFGASGLPPGLSIDPSSGLIWGTPLASGQFTIGVDAGNAVGIGTGTLSITVSHATPVFEPVQAFVRSPAKPYAKLIRGSDGNFYGTTYDGGSSGRGTVFKMTTAGTLTTLVNFNITNGSNPRAGLVEGSDGNFYGTTFNGGSSSTWDRSGEGTLFKMTAAGVLTTLANFDPSTGNPYGELVQGNDGNFYGTTSYTVFKITSAGTLTTLANFGEANSQAGLVQGNDGNFYGTTADGGSSDSGTVFKMTAAGTLTTLVNFNNTNGRHPRAGLVQGSDGNFYGTTSGGGSGGYGTVFKMTSTGVLTTLVNFAFTNGSEPYAGLVQGSDGNFYGTTFLGGSGNLANGTVFKMTAAGVLTTLVNFKDVNDINGCYPEAELVQGSDGNFYGTTSNGGFQQRGTVFKMTSAGVLTILTRFTDTKGSNPEAGLVQGRDGNFYGTTSTGGSGSNSGFGTVFKMTGAGVLTTLVSFNGDNGSNPQAGLVQGSDGNFYGTTIGGGSSGFGTVFKMTPAGVLTTLVNFTSANGSAPYAGLVQGSDGNFYGTTYQGGSRGYGTVFKMTKAGVLTTLVTFTGANGSKPFAGLVQGRDGNFYGTTTQGGSSGYGTVFKMTKTGALTTLVNFKKTNETNGGSNPYGELVQGSDGNFYGTTIVGGSSDNGTVFKMTSAGVLTTLVNFTNINGSHPQAGLVQDNDGNFYGTTNDGGSSGHGTVFKMTSAGVLTTLVNFTNTNGRGPTGLVQGSDGNLYGTTSSGGTTPDGQPAGGGQIYRMTNVSVAIPDLAVEAPTGTPRVSGADSLDFDSSVLGHTKDISVTLKNSGTARLTGISATIGALGPDGSQFAVVGAVPASLGTGASATFTIRFAPGTVGVKNATLSIASNDPDENPFTLALTGTGVAAPEIAVAQGGELTDGTSKVNFGNIKIGSNGVVKTFTIKNLGTANLTGLAIAKTGTAAANYTVSAVTAQSLAPGASTTFTVKFMPSSARVRSAALQIASNDSDENPFDITLVGTGLNPEIAVVQGTNLTDGKSKINFGSIRIGSARVTKIFTIWNLGYTTLTGLAVTKNGTAAANYTIGNLNVKSLAPGTSTTFKVTFKPSAKGTRTAVIHIASNDLNENPFDISLTGTGLAGSTAAKPSPLASAPATVGSQVSQGKQVIGSRQYLTLTYRQSAWSRDHQPIVEVSPNLLDWFSGEKHTTQGFSSAGFVTVRDKSPILPGAKRYIRLREN